MYVFDGFIYQSFNEMMDDIRWEYTHGNREAAMDKLDELNVNLTGI